jgi:hypothetical protein
MLCAPPVQIARLEGEVVKFGSATTVITASDEKVLQPEAA